MLFCWERQKGLLGDWNSAGVLSLLEDKDSATDGARDEVRRLSAVKASDSVSTVDEASLSFCSVGGGFLGLKNPMRLLCPFPS